MKTILMFAFTAISLFAQAGATVAISGGPPQEQAVGTAMFKDANGNLQYICQAQQPFNAFVWAITPNAAQQQGTLTSIVVSSNVGTVATVGNHGLQVNNMVTVAASTTAALNGSYAIATVPSTTTFTIATSGVSNGTYNNAAMTLATNAPRTAAAIWSIQKLVYDTSNFLTNRLWATQLTAGQYGTTQYRYICDNRSSYGYQ